MMRKRAKNETGFTLVELLMAMVASSLLLIMLGNVVKMLGHRLTVSSANRQHLSIERSASAFAMLVARTVPTDDPNAINIGAKSVIFPVQPSQNDDRQSPVLVQLNVNGAAGGNQLVASLVDPDSHQIIEGSQELLIATSKGELTLSAEEAVDAASDFRLTVIRVNWVDQRGRAHRWIAGPRINARPGCRFDPISLACRP